MIYRYCIFEADGSDAGEAHYAQQRKRRPRA